MSDWIHDVSHVRAVVKNGVKLAEMEGLRSKDAFLLEIACWLHDLGRAGEEVGLSPKQSNHAEISYWRSKRILKRYELKLGRESVYKIYQAVREHSLPVLRHPDNQIACFLLDADRGANLNISGVFRMLNYMEFINTEPVHSEEKARGMLDDLYKQIIESDKKDMVVDQLEVLRDWYYGCERQKVTGVRVTPLYSDSARKLYKKGLEEIEEFIERLK